MPIETTIQSGDALIVIDVQNDFLASGALAVPGGNEVVPVLNTYAARFERHRLPIFATRDWHPGDHSSFRRQGGPWPPHCVQFAPGAAFAPGLALPPCAVTISKGVHSEEEGYSAFDGTTLEAQLRAARVRRLFVGGLATDYCVLHTVRDAIARGFEVLLLRDAVRAVNLEPGSGQRAEEEMYRLGALPLTRDGVCPPNPGASALLTDVYELTMLQAYFEAKMIETAVFEFFVRNLPPNRNFLVAAGLEQVLDFLEGLHFKQSDLDWIESLHRFSPEFVQSLRGFRFTGEVHAMPEGTVFFAHEPILRITAPIAQAQLVETRLINLLQFQTLVASKAIRTVLAAPEKTLVDFGLRRAHGAEAGMLAARACYLAGFAATSDALAAQQFGIPASGTMAHSFVEAAASEEEAFDRFARANPQSVVLLIDTFDTEVAASKVVRLAPVLQAEGIRIEGVRIDSGDLAEHARSVRAILDLGGLRDAMIFASGNLDEYEVERILALGAPIDGFGVGTRIVTSADAPYLDCAYKLQVYAGQMRCKRSEGKSTWPGAKQVFRQLDSHGRMQSDIVALADEVHPGEALLRCVARDGRRMGGDEPLSVLRKRAAHQVDLLPPRLRLLAQAEPYPVVMSERLHDSGMGLGVSTHPLPLLSPKTPHG